MAGMADTTTCPDCGGDCDSIVAALESATDDHGPGCDGPLNCTCEPPVDPAVLPRYFVVFDIRHRFGALVVDKAFATLAEAQAYVGRYGIARRELGYAIFRGEAVSA